MWIPPVTHTLELKVGQQHLFPCNLVSLSLSLSLTHTHTHCNAVSILILFRSFSCKEQSSPREGLA